MAVSGRPLNTALEGMNDHHRLAEKLEGVLAGTMDILALLDDALSYGEPMKHCYHGLWHYQSDADIRAKDPAYRSMQDSEMRKLIDLLRTEAPGSKLSRVSFLGVS